MRERSLIASPALNLSEQHRRLALAGGFRLLRSFGGISEGQAIVSRLFICGGSLPFFVHDSLLHNSGLFGLGVCLRLRSRHALRWREDYLK
jgi:hypothetical protein